MKGNEVSYVQVKAWEKDGYFPVCCRICGEIILYPKEHYRQEDFQSYKCADCKRIIGDLYGRRYDGR